MSRPNAPRNPNGTLMAAKPSTPSTPAPALDDTTGSNLRFQIWLAAETAAGNINARDADSLEGIAKGHLAAIRTQHGLHELEELRDLVTRQEAAIAELTRHETQDRYSAGTGGEQSFGRVRMPPDGEPH